MTVKISSRGQTVIPAKIRKRYGIHAHSKVEFLDTGKEIVLIPISKNPFLESKGILRKITSYDLIESRRQERKREHG